MPYAARTSSGGFDLELTLDRVDLLPGRLVDGILRIRTGKARAIRGARITLDGTEQWRYDATRLDADGRTHTEIATGEAALPAVPIAVLGPTSFPAGDVREVAFQLPVPSLGPATFEATEFSVDWAVRAHVDVPGLDPSLTVPVRILQPTALLRAGVIDVGEFALYPEADTEASGFSGSIRLEPVPLCVGASFRGRLELRSATQRKVQEVRIELRVSARSTVSGGRREEITVWTGVLAGPGSFGGSQTLPFDGVLPVAWLPTVETAHGRSDARFHVIIATAFAPDPHLIRDVAMCSTTEI